ncbi:MAG: hypothetical protein BWZ08_02131 [candidate division BRC1 bacterium ADurb.BinA292]|nr:MAG: hypothetical protein BWZ08_02131 [candidate division BRC1 bacterium ADurb.BinA292]
MRHRPLHRAWSVRGLTYGEMLIVLAIFSVLAVIFVFSSKHAMVKTRLSATIQTQRNFSSEFEAFRAYTGRLPGETTWVRELSQPAGGGHYVPDDPFVPDGAEERKFEFYKDIGPATAWVLVSVGPDGDSDLKEAIRQIRSEDHPTLVSAESAGFPMGGPLTARELRELVERYSYDPTNGTISDGDVIYVSY